MVAGSSDLVRWLARELALALVEDSEDGAVLILEGTAAPAASLIEVVCLTAGLGAVDESVAGCIERARAGAPGGVLAPTQGQARILAWPIGPGRARVLVASHSDSVVRRAAAADLAAGVTHEVANALTAIAGWTRLASTGGPLPERTREALEVVQRSAREALGSARGLLTTMRDSARPALEPSQGTPTDVGLVVCEVLETLRPELEEARIELSADLDSNVLALISPSALRLIVGNLVRNAFQALARGGSIDVVVRSQGERLGLTIADDGPGMDPETLALAFDRYFTTKAEGTGLGLALVKDTVNEAGGQLDVVSRRGRGTRFEVSLPVAGAPRLSLRPPAVRSSNSGVHPRPFLHRRQVLVVDDDRALRSMVRTALELQGAEVATASSCAEARSIRADFDIALVDFELGDGRGDALLADLRRAGRARHGVVLTGSTEPLSGEGEPDAVLRKPFELDDLHRVLEGILTLGAAGAEDG